jgi:hypothetical protein
MDAKHPARANQFAAPGVQLVDQQLRSSGLWLSNWARVLMNVL